MEELNAATRRMSGSRLGFFLPPMEELNADKAWFRARGIFLSTSHGGTERVVPRRFPTMRRVFLPPMEELNGRMVKWVSSGTVFLPPMEELNATVVSVPKARTFFLPPMEELNREEIRFSRTGLPLSTSHGGTERMLRAAYEARQEVFLPPMEELNFHRLLNCCP